MSMKKWPFIPDRLSDIFDEELIRFIQSGSSVRLRAAVAIVEFRLNLNGKPEPYYIPADDPWLNYCNFCKYLRKGNFETDAAAFPGADEVCRSFDESQALSYFEGRLFPESKRDGIGYFCHMGLCDAIAPIRVAGNTVACLFSGQFLPTTPERIAAIKNSILDIQNSKKPGIKLGSGDPNKLSNFLKKVPILPNNFIDKLEDEAKPDFQRLITSFKFFN